MMDTKMQALEKAQNMQRNNVNNRCSVNDYNNPTRFEVIKGGNVIGVFKYSDPIPLEKDTYCMCSDGVMRYAMGELDSSGVNMFYHQGCCSKNIEIPGYFTFENFEIIETPCEFERIQTPDHECVNSGCARYINKWLVAASDKFLNGDCERCMVLIGTPSKLKDKK